MLASILLFVRTCHGFTLKVTNFIKMGFSKNKPGKHKVKILKNEGSHMDMIKHTKTKAAAIDRISIIRTFTTLLLAFVFLSVASPLWAESKEDDQEEKFFLPQESVTIGDLVQYAYQNNPSIVEAREDWKASIEEYRVTEGYPDPKLNFTYFIDPIETRLGPQDWNATLSQKIPFPGRLSRAGEVAMADAEIARLQFDKAIRDVIVATRESFYELYYIRKAKIIIEKNEDLLDHMRKVSETEYAQNRALLLDVVKDQSQIAQLKFDALLMDDLEITEITNLNGLLNRLPDDPIGTIVVDEYSPIVFSLD